MPRLPWFSPLIVLAATACVPQTGPQPASSFTPASRGPVDGRLIGLDTRGLERQFGTPRLDIRDPAARKLQFANGRCILDAYLYPPRDGREPIVTYVEARGLDGRAVDSNACAETLRRR